MEDFVGIILLVLLFSLGALFGAGLANTAWRGDCLNGTPIVIDKKVYYCVEKK